MTVFRIAAWTLRTIYRRHSREWVWRAQSIDRLAGTDELRKAVESGDEAVRALLARWETESREFAAARERFLLYR